MVFHKKHEKEHGTALTKDEEHVISEELLKSNKTLSVILVSNLRVSMDDTLKTLNIVVYILIIAAGLLAFVVLYNLNNVNVSEIAKVYGGGGHVKASGAPMDNSLKREVLKLILINKNLFNY